MLGTWDQVIVEPPAVLSFPVSLKQDPPPEFAQSLPSSPLNQLRQEVNDQKSLGGLVRKENKGQNLKWEVGGCES